MNSKRTHFKSVVSMVLALVMLFSIAPTSAFASQEDNYHDPAEHWLTANNRTNELDANAVVTHETSYCKVCEQYTSFMVWRTPEYTRDGATAMSRNVKYSDGTLMDGEGTGAILDGTPGVDAYYTGYHWTKVMCEICGTMHSNGGGYSLGKNIYYLYDCASYFMEELPQEVSYAYADSTYHTKTTSGGTYCCFCFGTWHNESSTLERHSLSTSVDAQLPNHRFEVESACTLCDYEKSSYLTAKSVVSDYYGVVDGQAHTLTVSDLSDSGVSTKIRYGNSANSCTLTSAPSYTTEGQYTVYYEIVYTYNSTSMTENGVAYVWLYDESKDTGSSGSSNTTNNQTDDTSCTANGGHNYTLLDTVSPTCENLGYDRYMCLSCGTIEKRNYTNALDHMWQSVVVRDASCETEGKTMNICQRCGEVEVIYSSKGEHKYETYTVSATCTNPGYTVKECAVCGDRQITDITSALAHNYTTHITPATCENGGKTVYLCEGCGSSFVSGYTDALGHKYNSGKVITNPSCAGEGVIEYDCLNCDYHYLEAVSADGHTPGDAATCEDPQLCTVCGVVLKNATGHSFIAEVIPASCEDMGYTEYTCENCGSSYKTDYTKILGHDYEANITDPTCLEGGFTTFICTRCEGSYVTDYTDALGHEWDEGVETVSPSCTGEGLMEFACVRCDTRRLESLPAAGHTPGDEATCEEPQLCDNCGAVLEKALGHDFEVVVTEPTCTEMGYTTNVCTRCGLTHKLDYTNPTGHKETDWIIDEEPTTDSEGNKHKECENCGDTLEDKPIEKLYLTSTTDSKGEAVVGNYLVIVTDTNTTNPVSGAKVVLNEDDTLSIRLPNGRLLDYAEQTTVTVLLTKDKSPVEGIKVAVTDKNSNYCADVTDGNGQLTVPDADSYTNGDGKVTFGYEDEEGNRQTLTVIVTDNETGRPVENAYVTIDRLGRLTIKLPEGVDMDENNRIKVVVFGNDKKPVSGLNVIVTSDLGEKAEGNTDKDGTLVVPTVKVTAYHGEYIYGYTDGTFGPERNMTRSEAAAIFARILAEKNGDTITTAAKTKFEDIPANCWYSGDVKYLTGYGVVVGTSDTTFEPEKDITRAEFVAMAVRFFEAYGDGNAEIMEQYAEFNDVSSGYWAAEYIKDAAIHGWIYGYGDGTFRAEQNITRAEVVTIVNRLLDRTADREYIAENLRRLNTFSDMETSHWAYYAVMEAANAHTAWLDSKEAWSK